MFPLATELADTSMAFRSSRSSCALSPVILPRLAIGLFPRLCPVADSGFTAVDMASADALDMLNQWSRLFRTGLIG